MANAIPKAAIQTILANIAIPIERISRANPAKIVKGLDDGDASLFTRAVYGRRDHEEGVMNVDDVRRFAVKQLREFPSRAGRPDGILYEGNLSERPRTFNFCIAATVNDYVVPPAVQVCILLLEDDIFPTAQLIAVVD